MEYLKFIFIMAIIGLYFNFLWASVLQKNDNLYGINSNEEYLKIK